MHSKTSYVNLFTGALGSVDHIITGGKPESVSALNMAG